VLASSNRGKLLELGALLGELPVELLRARDVLGCDLEVEEDGLTFEANAEKKARAACAATGMVSLADDSGLEVDALGGRPGVRSARYAGALASDEANNQKLLREIEGTPDAERTARFRCVLALASPRQSRSHFAEGACEGLIARAPRGQNGFGYDPVFIATELGERTMAELDPEEKNRISHRHRAAFAMLPALRELIAAKLRETERAT
jgi:XTP/dITP diphosphohydrolase